MFDPRLDALKSDLRWRKMVIPKIKDIYSSLKQPTTAFALDSLGKEDQKCRTLKKYIENLNPYFEATDSTDRRFEVNFNSDTTSDLCSAKDEAHFLILRKIIGEHDWPKISEVGSRPAKCACFILSHTSDSISIGHYLPLIKQRCAEGEAEWLYYAMLYDRLQVMKGLRQRFGTQYKPERNIKGELELFPLEDPTQVNQWRKEIGIERIDDIQN